ncbi:MAG TPA: hypothetical protein VGH56_09595 [Solirubrobacteraceae bacterium]
MPERPNESSNAFNIGQDDSYRREEVRSDSLADCGRTAGGWCS